MQEVRSHSYGIQGAIGHTAPTRVLLADVLISLESSCLGSIQLVNQRKYLRSWWTHRCASSGSEIASGGGVCCIRIWTRRLLELNRRRGLAMVTNPDPTDEGQCRYSATDGFFDIAAFFVMRRGQTRLVPCRCRASCSQPCLGSCGCQACAWRSAAEGPEQKKTFSALIR